MRTVWLGIGAVAGAVLGAFAVLWLQGAGWIARPVPRVTGAIASGIEAGGDDREADASRLAALEQALRDRLAEAARQDFVPLAVALEDAAFERDWDAVELLAAIVRERGPQWAADLAAAQASAPEPPPVDTASSTASLLAAHRRLERRQAEQALARRVNAATLLAGRSDPEAISRLGVLLTTAEAPQVRRDAAALLARSGDQRALELLETALRDPDTITRTAAGAALARYGWLEGVQALVEVVREAAGAQQRREAIEALASYDAVVLGQRHPATDALLAMLRDPREPALRTMVCEAIGARIDLEHAGRWRTALLERITEDPVPAVRRAAAGAVATALEHGELGPRSQQLLLAALEHTTDPELAALLLPPLAAADPAILPALDRLAAGSLGASAPALLDSVRQRLRVRAQR